MAQRRLFSAHIARSVPWHILSQTVPWVRQIDEEKKGHTHLSADLRRTEVRSVAKGLPLKAELLLYPILLVLRR